MSARFLLLGTSILLASCATAQENPNYQYSTKYGTSQTQVANNGYAPQNAPASIQTASTQTAGVAPTHTGYIGNEGVTLATTQATSTPPPTTSPTERAYDATRMQGTPGYEMMRAQQSADVYPAPSAPTYQSAPAPDYTPYTPPVAAPLAASGPRQITYDYGDNVSGTQTALNQPSASRYEPMIGQGRTGTAANIATGQTYVVREGDTVYSLSRRLCTPIADITTANAIGGDYGIAIGQTLSLPNSRC